MEKLTDWKGNEIKPGHRVVQVRIKPLFGRSQLCLINNGKLQPLHDILDEPEYIWEPLDEYLVQGNEEYMVIFTEQGPYTLATPLSSLFLFKSDSIIICIKGFSDNEEDFYLNYFSNET